MLRHNLLHPDLTAALAGAGHGSRVLVADGNYPASTASNRNGAIVYLNLTRDVVDAVTVLRAVCSAIPVEEACVMAPLAEGPYAMDSDPDIWKEFSAVLADAGSPVGLDPLERMAFYAAARADDVALTVVSGETRLYANILLRIGVEL